MRLDFLLAADTLLAAAALAVFEDLKNLAGLALNVVANNDKCELHTLSSHHPFQR